MDGWMAERVEGRMGWWIHGSLREWLGGRVAEWMENEHMKKYILRFCAKLLILL
jgi:hypothetical protein